MFRFVLLCFIVTIFQTSSSQSGYYWREYTASGIYDIPEDAVIGGRNSNNDSIYIGQGYIQNYGELPGEIHPNVASIEVEANGAIVVDRYLKILCGVQNNFAWLSTDSDHLHLDLNGFIPVLGGHEDDVKEGSLAYYFIGKIHTASGEKLGKILQFEHSYHPNMMFYVDEHESKSASTYDVLIVANY